MIAVLPRSGGDELTLRQSAVIAGAAYLLMPVTYAEFAIMPKLVIQGNVGQTAQNIVAHQRLFGVAILCYLITLLEDIVIAWALYFFLAPVNRPMSLLAAWFRLMYTAVALFAWANLLTAYHLVAKPDYLMLFGSGPLNAQLQFLLDAFRYQWSASLGIFGVHLALLGYLIFRSSYVPTIWGVLLAIDGFGWAITSMRPYLYPNFNLPYFLLFAFVELLFALWLLIWGGRQSAVSQESQAN